MKNSTTITATTTAINEISIAMPDDLRTRPVQLPYDEMLAIAMKGNKAAKGELVNHLKSELEKAEKVVVTTATNLKERKGSTRDANVAKFRLARNLFKDLVSKAEALSTRKGGSEAWEPFVDHHITEEPSYVGKASTMDRIRLLIGKSITDEQGKQRHMRGLASLDLPNFGIISISESGWMLSLNGNTYPMSGNDLHTLLTQSLKPFIQRLPFSTACVMATDSQDNITDDGISVVIPADVTFTSLEEQVVLRNMVRISMPAYHYNFLVWSVAFSRYGITGPNGEMVDLDKAVRRALGTPRIPENAIELEFAHTCHWLSRKKDPSQFIGKGRLYGYTEEDLVDLASFTVAYQREQEKTLTRIQEAQAKRAQKGQVALEAEPFQEPVGDDLV